jgi:hypothetical protein
MHPDDGWKADVEGLPFFGYFKRDGFEVFADLQP